MKRVMTGGVALAMAALFSATSLAASVADYVQAGCPPPDRVWTGEDYQKFNELLQSGKIALPMLNDASKPIFLALVNREALAPYANKDVPVKDRLQACLKGYLTLAPVLSKYDELQKGGKVDCSKEEARFMAYALYASTTMVNLVEEFLPTVPKDENYAARMAGVKQMKDGNRTILLGETDCLGERKTFADEEVLIMADAMMANLPTLGDFVGPAVVQEVRAKAAGFLEKEKSEKVKSAIERLVKMCDSLAPPSAPSSP